MESELPSLYPKTYSKCNRKRRRNIKIPTRYHNTYLRCIEYPDGIYINSKGVPDETKCNVFPDELCEDSDSNFDDLPPKKKNKLMMEAKKEEEECLNDYMESLQESYEFHSEEDKSSYKDLIADDDYYPSDNEDDDEDSDDEDVEEEPIFEADVLDADEQDDEQDSEEEEDTEDEDKAADEDS